jgi:hypothetical protein
VYRKTLEHTKSAAERIRNHKLTQAALAKTGDHLAALQVTAAKAGESFSRHIDAAVASIEGQKAAKKGGRSGGAAAGEAGSGAKDQAQEGDNTRGLATESFDDAGEAAEVAAAAAAGDIVDAVLLAPGRLLYVKPIDENVAEENHKFELVDGQGGE